MCIGHHSLGSTSRTGPCQSPRRSPVPGRDGYGSDPTLVSECEASETASSIPGLPNPSSPSVPETSRRLDTGEETSRLGTCCHVFQLCSVRQEDSTLGFGRAAMMCV